MTSRDAIVGAAQSQLGIFTGQGFDNPNRYSQELGLPTEAWCADFITWLYVQKQVPLPSMQPGHPTGYSFCPDAVNYGRAHGLVRNSWEAQPGDIVLFDWHPQDGVSDHTEVVIAMQGENVITIGGNSGPSGGVNQHSWSCPAGVGNSVVLAVLNVDQLVNFGSPQAVPAPIAPPVNAPPPPGAPAWPGRMIVLKTPMMTGSDVQTWQTRMAQRGWGIATDGVYGAGSRDFCMQFQTEKHIGVDGQVGPETWNAAFDNSNVTV